MRLVPPAIWLFVIFILAGQWEWEALQAQGSLDDHTNADSHSTAQYHPQSSTRRTSRSIQRLLLLSTTTSTDDERQKQQEQEELQRGHHPPGIGHHPPGVGHHPPGVGHHPPGVGHHPPGVGHHPPGVGHHKKASPLARAYRALQAWKLSISRDPLNITASWVGTDVCTYKGVFCGPALHDPSLRVVSGIDLNHANLGGQLPEELGLLSELGILHLNSNQFTGSLPAGLSNLVLLGELDVSNNKLSGPFPSVVLQLPSLIYLDIRFNRFSGRIPAALFNKQLDALFINNNNFENTIPDNLGNSPVSVAVFANNRFTGAIPRSIGNMSRTLNEIIFLNNIFAGSLPSEIGFLKEVTVFDVSFNKLSSNLPNSISSMVSLEEFNVANNLFSGNLTGSVCGLPNIRNLTFSNNYFIGESALCANLASRGVTVSTGGNCLSNQAGQKSGTECRNFYAHRPPSVPSPTPPLQNPRTPPASPAPLPPFPVSPVFPPPPVFFSPPPVITFPPPPVTFPPPVSFPPPPLSFPPPPLRAPVPVFPPPPLTAPVPPTTSTCPSGYAIGRKSGHCFMLVVQHKTWSQAEDYCRQQSGRLASVADMNELLDIGDLCNEAPPNQALIDPYSPKGQGCYLGGRRANTSNSAWTWPSFPCIPFNSSYWNFLEPNDLYGNENCTSIKYEPPILRASAASPAYMLNDLFCDYELPFVCSTPRC